MIQIIPSVPDQGGLSGHTPDGLPGGSQSDHLSSIITRSALSASIPVKPGVLSSELWLMILFFSKNMAVLLVILGRVDTAQQQVLSDMLAAFAGAVCVAAFEGAALWRYTASRETLKQSAMMLRVPMPEDSVAQGQS